MRVLFSCYIRDRKIKTGRRTMRNPSFMVRKRKRETGWCLIRKKKKEIGEVDDDYDPKERNNVKNPKNLVILEGIEDEEDSRRHPDDDNGGSEPDEREENPRNDMDEEDEGADEENISLVPVNGETVNMVGGEGKDVEGSSKTEFLVVSEMRRDGGDTPPDDDCCPICFDNFTIACKTNCGHWFCANCILQFWTYRSVLQKCKCPICARPISKLTPEASLLILQEVEVIEVLKNVRRYNRLFQGGINGVLRKVFEVPNVFKRMLCGLMDPDRFRGNYYAMRSFALLLSCIYNVNSFDFIPTGTLGVRRLFDLCAIALVVILCLVGICHRLMLRRRVRRLAANQL